MAVQAQYKKFNRGQRQANVETDFSKGMMYSEGAVSEGYVKTLVNFDFTQDGKNALKPRAALQTREFIIPDMNIELDPDIDQSDREDYLSGDTLIKYSRECNENGQSYKQFILGKVDVNNGIIENTGKIWAVTSSQSRSGKIDLEKPGVIGESLIVSPSERVEEAETCSFYSTKLSKVHDVELTEDAKASFPVGSFMGNSFYFFNNYGSGGVLKHTKFNGTKYVFETVPVKNLIVSEAVYGGYNMLDPTPYDFLDATSQPAFEMTGILPYSSSFSGSPLPKPIMQPRANSRVWFRCNYDVTSGESYIIVWSWKEVTADEWVPFNTEWDAENPFNSTGTPVLEADLIVPSKEILIRCEAYNISDPDVVEKAMTVGFDFTLDTDSSTWNTQPETYDLSTASGMTSWKNRLVVWGVEADPTILFISDLDEPGYFPYPNNISIFEDPIISVVELMDNLIVFTTNKVYQVTLNKDGFTWTSEVIQSHLYIEPWDKHLIQPVRNMIYFKSGNYYYMLVPKAQSTTGELTLAPITTPITDFFNHFKMNVANMFKDCFKEIVDGEVVQNYPEELVTYYNFIDYEDIHNFYVYRYNDTFVHLDIIYNTVDRYWKINVYETAHFLYPFRNNATENGLFALTNTIMVTNSEDENPLTTPQRVIQILEFNKLEIEDVFITSGTSFVYDTTHESITINNDILELPVDMGSYDADSETFHLNPECCDLRDIDMEILHLLDASNWIDGISMSGVLEGYKESYGNLKDLVTFKNKQMLDSGYRDAGIFINKRYRELQLEINNIDNVDMTFGMDFQISGEPRNTDFLYEVSQVIDELRQDQGIVYLDATPYLPIESSMDDKIDKTNTWRLEHASDPNVSFWKVRAAVSGKGTAPRLRLFTKDMFNYQLLGINWIYREMNMR